jgi:hypothetical protein
MFISSISDILPHSKIDLTQPGNVCPFLATPSSHLQANETQSAIDIEALKSLNESLSLAARTAEANQRRDADACAQVPCCERNVLNQSFAFFPPRLEKQNQKKQNSEFGGGGRVSVIVPTVFFEAGINQRSRFF